MIRLLFFILICISLPLCGNAQWTCLNPKPTYENLGATYFVNDDCGFIFGNGNICLKTIDGGTTWQFQDPGVVAPLYSVFFTDSLSGTAVGYLGTIIKTDNGGMNWNDISTQDPTLSSVFFPSPNIGYAVGEQGNVIKTTDGGWTWSHCTPLPHTLYDLWFTSDSTGYVVGEEGLVAKTTDAGQTWSELASWFSSDASLSSIAFTSQDTGYFAGVETIFSTFVYKTTNGGATWVKVLDSAFCYFSELTISNGQTVYVSFPDNEGFYYYKTTDGGNTWTFHSDLYSAGVCIKSFPSSDRGFATGRAGGIYRTDDGGNTWIAESSGTRNDIQDIDFSSDSIGYFCTNKQVYRSVDSGYHWDTVFFGDLIPPNDHLRQVCFPGNATGYVRQLNDLWKTTDGGNSWTLLEKPYPYSSLGPMCFLSDNTGYLCTGKPFMLKTTNGGLSWEISDLPYYYVAYDICFLNESVGWVACISSFESKSPNEMGVYCQTTDGGVSWVKHSFGKNCDWDRIFFVDENTGFLAGTKTDSYEKYPLYKTTNGGNNWVEITEPDMGIISEIRFIDLLHGYIVTEEKIWYTEDGGLTWSIELNNPSVSYYSIETGSTIYVGGTNGMLLAHPCPFPTSVDYFSTPPEYLSSTVYPNPAKGQATIRYYIPVDETAELILTDGIGRTIYRSRLSGYRNGWGEYDLDLRTLHQGIYYYIIRAHLAEGRGKLVVVE